MYRSFRKDLKTILRIFLITTGVIISSSCYILGQAGPFLQHHLCAEPIDRLIENSAIPWEDRIFLSQVIDIREFAITDLGLADTANYTTYFRIDRDYLAAVIQAAPEFNTEPYMFSYPFFGEMPYQGYYNIEQALSRADQLREQGLDVYIRRVDAFSSLGFFTDPLFSFMADYSPDRLAELIIHEQTHATIFISGHSGFNEQLATFIGRKGAQEYIISRYGEDSPEYRQMTARKHDSQQFREDISLLTRELEELYAYNYPEQVLRGAKAAAIREFQTQFLQTYDSNYHSAQYRGLGTMEINNGFLSLFRVYEAASPFFEALYQESGSIQAMIQYLQSRPELHHDPWSIPVS
ncbi:MAG: aminopeptidase [Spirochaetia bacterium]